MFPSLFDPEAPNAPSTDCSSSHLRVRANTQRIAPRQRHSDLLSPKTRKSRAGLDTACCALRYYAM